MTSCLKGLLRLTGEPEFELLELLVLANGGLGGSSLGNELVDALGDKFNGAPSEDPAAFEEEG